MRFGRSFLAYREIPEGPFLLSFVTQTRDARPCIFGRQLLLDDDPYSLMSTILITTFQPLSAIGGVKCPIDTGVTCTICSKSVRHRPLTCESTRAPDLSFPALNIDKTRQDNL
jgi:hypothetical protein